MQEEFSYEFYEQKKKLQVNFLKEQKVKSKRLGALNYFNNAQDFWEEEGVEASAKEKFFKESLLPLLLEILDGETEKHKLVVIEIISRALESFGLNQESEIILSHLEVRLRYDRVAKKFPEQSEQIRLRLLKEVIARMMLQKLGKPGENGSLYAKIVASLLCDSNPKMKKEILTFLVKLCQGYGTVLGAYVRPVIGGLKDVLSFKHGAVRAQAARAFACVLELKEAQLLLLDIQSALKQAASDSKKNVRLAVFETVGHLMNNYEFSNVQKFEAYFVHVMLQGISDEEMDVRTFCWKTLEDFSEKMEHTLKQLEERDQAQLINNE